MTALQKLMGLAGAGALGALARYGLGGAVQRLSGASAFPWGTLAVNALGCFLFGVVWSLAEERMLMSPEARVIALVGFLGAFTTFSSFAFETVQFVRDSQWAFAAANILAQNILGVAAVFAGMAAGRAL